MRPALALLVAFALMPAASAQPAVDENGFPVPAAKTPAKPKAKSAEDYGPKLNPLVRALRTGQDADKVRACRSMAKLGKEAAPAARPLCDAAADPIQEVRVAALEALEIARPDLHEPAVMLAIDGNPANQLKAVEALSAMGAEATPALGLLLRRLDSFQTTRPIEGGRDGVRFGKPAALTFDAIKLIGPEDAKVMAFFAARARPDFKSARPGERFSRLDAITYMVEYAGDDAKRRALVAPLVVSGIDDGSCRAYCVPIAGEYGRLCKAAVPALKLLKPSPDAATRAAATEAIGKIGGD